MLNLNSILITGTIKTVNLDNTTFTLKHPDQPYYFTVSYFNLANFIPEPSTQVRVVGSLGYYIPIPGYPRSEMCIDAQYIETNPH